MIILVLHTSYNEKLYRNETVVSHGIDYNTMKNIPLPQEPISYFRSSGAYFHQELNEWVLEN